MAENHELRLTIDAAPAKRGSREFVAAVEAVKKAVSNLEKDSTGAFTKLKKHMQDVSKLGNVKVGGVDKQSLRDLNSYAKATAEISKTAASSQKTLKSMIQTVRGLSDSYGMASRTSKQFAADILKTNSALMRQIQLASQARSAVRQVRTAPATGGTAASSVASAASANASTAALSAQFGNLSKAMSALETRANKMFTAVKTGADNATKSTQAFTASARSIENAQLSATSAIRTAESAVNRLTQRMMNLGDTRGVTELNRALITLKSSLNSNVTDTIQVRKAMDQFNQVAHKTAISTNNMGQSQLRASKEARTLAKAENDAAAAARKVEREMRSIDGASTAASKAWQKATGNMRGLENAFNGTFQAGSLFRTMIGSITFGTFTSSVFRAADALDQFLVSMQVATGSTNGAYAELGYIDDVASRLGIGLQSARDNYSKFAIAADVAGVEASQTRKIFESVSTAMAVLGKGTQDQELAFLALEQMMSKGTVSSEELRRQLGERMPGAVQMMAQALGVTNEELQKLLKLGAISSADALPKFADVVMNRFGPQLEQATQRAGYNLGTLRNEIQKLSETVGQAGFMQTLSVQFARLTQVLRGDDAYDAATKLGEGLAQLAEQGTDAMLFLADNIDTVLAGLKALAVGIGAVKVTQLVQGFVMSAQQSMAFFAQLGKGNAAMSQAELAAHKHTAALTANTKALTANAAAMSGKTKKTEAARIAEEAAMRQTILGNTAASKFQQGLTKVGNGAQAAAGGLAFMGRALGAAVPWIGIATTALMFLPDLFGDTADSADDMSIRAEAAMRRAASAVTDFDTVAAKSTARRHFDMMFADINALNGRKIELTVENAQVMEALSALKDSAAEGFVTKSQGKALDAVGIDPSDLEGLNSGAQQAIAKVAELGKGLALGTVTASEFDAAATAAMARWEGADKVLAPVAEWAKEIGDLSKASTANVMKLVDMIGTASEKSLLGVAKQAVGAISSDDMGAYNDVFETIKALKKETPGLAAQLDAIGKAMASNAGGNPYEFMEDVLPLFDATVRKHQELKDAVETTAAAVDASADGLFDTTEDELQRVIRSLQGANEVFNDAALMDGVLGVVEQFTRFQDVAMPLQQVQNILGDLTFPEAAASEAKRFTDAIAAQFGQLSTSEQTYENFRRITQEVADAQNLSTGYTAQLTSQLADLSNTAADGAVSVYDVEDALRAQFDALGLATPAVEEMIQALVDEAYGHAEVTSEAHTSVGAMNAAAGAALRTGDAHSAGAGGVLQMAAAFDALNAAKSAAGTASGDVLGDLKEELRIAKLTGNEKKIAIELNKAASKDAISALNAQRDAAIAARDAATDGITRAAAEAAITEADNALSQFKDDVATTVTAIAAANEANKPGRSGGGGGKSRKEKLTEEQKAVEKLNDSIKSRLANLQTERYELTLLASGQFETTEAAKLMAEAMYQGGGSVDAQTEAMIRQIDAAGKLNEELQTLAKDPVKEWMDSVPNWTEAAQQIEMGAVNSLKDSLVDFMETGELDFMALGDSIISMANEIIAEKAVKELLDMFGRGDAESNGLAGWFQKLGASGDGSEGGLFSNGDSTVGTAMGGLNAANAAAGQAGVAAVDPSVNIQNAFVSGGQQAATMIQNALTQGATQTQGAITQGATQGAGQMRQQTAMGGQQAAQQAGQAGRQHASEVGRAIEAAGTSHASKVGAAAGGSAGVSGGSSGGGFWSTVFSGATGMLTSMFSEGGYSDMAGMSSTMMSPAAFANAPHFSEGTANTSGIPAVLHPNEAVIPLSKGRKIPIDMPEGAGGGNTNITNQNFNIQTPDADSFRRSKKQVAADMARSSNRAARQNG